MKPENLFIVGYVLFLAFSGLSVFVGIWASKGLIDYTNFHEGHAIGFGVFASIAIFLIGVGFLAVLRALADIQERLLKK